MWSFHAALFILHRFQSKIPMGKSLPMGKFPSLPSPTKKTKLPLWSPLPLSKHWHIRVTAHWNNHSTHGEAVLKNTGPTAVFWRRMFPFGEDFLKIHHGCKILQQEISVIEDTGPSVASDRNPPCISCVNRSCLSLISSDLYYHKCWKLNQMVLQKKMSLTAF